MKKKSLVAGLIIVVLIALFMSLYGGFIEYNEIGGYSSVFITNLIAKAALYLIAFVFVMALLSTGTYFAKKAFNKGRTKLIYINLGISLLLSFTIGQLSYEKALIFLNSVGFGMKDPVFSIDIGYYVFIRPFLVTLVASLSTIFFINIIYIFFVYLFFTSKDDFTTARNMIYDRRVVSHTAVNIMMFIILKAAEMFLSGGALLFGSFRGLTGAGFVARNIWRVFYTVAPIILIIISAVALFYIFRMQLKKAGMLILGFGAACLLVLLSAMAVQYVYVTPRQATIEGASIQNNINFTRQGFNVDKVKESIFPTNYNLSVKDLEENKDTIDSIRIMDIDATLKAINSLQQTRGYYNFTDSDIVSYNINGRLTGVNTAVREFDEQNTPDNNNSNNNNFINKRLRYTHSYGITMNAVNEVTSEGQPKFLVKDVPLKISEGAPNITQPRIYFGEHTNDYVIANSGYNELSYMEGGNSVEFQYDGQAGIRMTTFNKAFYALKNADIMVLFSNYVNSDSKMLVNRNIVERVRKIAPYLVYDPDPYVVVSGDGKLKWIIDGYTITDKYPYSQNYGGINYIRNSVKAIVDAYDGTVDFYVTDDSDPIIKVYDNIYHGVFKHDEIPKDISEHFRYPEFMFKIQMQVYQNYHVTDPEILYSNSDKWLIAKEKYLTNEELDIAPYYNVMSIDKVNDDMVLMLPFIPNGGKNLIAWTAVSSRADSYGQILLYKFPEGQPVYGTMQIENKIDSDANISKEISLWNNGGSKVIRGNLLVVPIVNSIIYVEPIYLTTGNQGEIPQLKRVVVAYGENVVMKNTLREALYALFGEVVQEAVQAPQISSSDLTQVQTVYKQMKDALSKSDWTEFARLMVQMDELLK